MTTCSACVSGFTLASNSQSCVSDCTANITNCLFCSSNTTCSVCAASYVVSNGSCALPCSAINNCVTCYSATQCASCSSGFAPSANLQTCDIVCLVAGCSVCASSSSTTCTTCASGYSNYTVNNETRCALNCGSGQVDTGSGTVNCQSCSTLIANCVSCSVQTGASTTVFCDSCLDGFFVNGQTCSQCSSAINNCLLCSGATTCTECSAGFNLVGGVCTNVTCVNQTNCHACSSSNTAVCAQC